MWRGCAAPIPTASRHGPKRMRRASQRLWPDVRPLRFRRVPFRRDVAFDPGEAAAPRMTVPHILPSRDKPQPTQTTRAIGSMERLAEQKKSR
jgi:hypothetical protein